MNIDVEKYIPTIKQLYELVLSMNLREKTFTYYNGSYYVRNTEGIKFVEQKKCSFYYEKDIQDIYFQEFGEKFTSELGEFYVAFGATKVVLMFEEFVLKVGYDVREDTMAVSREIEVFNNIKTKFKHCLATIYTYGSIRGEELITNVKEFQPNDIQFLFQERIEKHNNEGTSNVTSSVMRSDVFFAFEEYYGKRFTKQLDKELFSMKVNDLHKENYGVRKNGEIVFLDYGGYSTNGDVFSKREIKESFVDKLIPKVSNFLNWLRQIQRQIKGKDLFINPLEKIK